MAGEKRQELAARLQGLFVSARSAHVLAVPKSAQLDVADVLQHRIGGDIEQRGIFRETQDSEEVLRRLSDVVVAGDGHLLA